MGLPGEVSKPLRDAYKREIDYLRISITDRCNLNCLYCLPHMKEKHFSSAELLTAEEIVRFVRAARRHGLRKVRLTGGEPLLREDLDRIIAGIKAEGIEDLSLTTNGVLFERKARELQRAGLDRVNISLDTLRPDRYSQMTGGGDINRVWGAIAEAEALGLTPVKINAVPIRGTNDDEVADFAALTIKRDFHVRFIEYMPVGRANICLKGACVKKEEILKSISVLGELRPLEFKGRGPSRNYRLAGAAGIIGIISPISERFCEQCNRLRLTADGKVKPCLLSTVQVDIRGPLREGVSDKGLEALFASAIAEKPEGHTLCEDGSFSGLSSMSNIGG